MTIIVLTIPQTIVILFYFFFEGPRSKLNKNIQWVLTKIIYIILKILKYYFFWLFKLITTSIFKIKNKYMFENQRVTLFIHFLFSIHNNFWILCVLRIILWISILFWNLNIFIYNMYYIILMNYMILITILLYCYFKYFNKKNNLNKMIFNFSIYFIFKII